MNNDNMSSNMVCPQCGMPNVSNAKFCVKCGKDLRSEMMMGVPQFNNEEVKPEVNEIPSREVFNNVMPQFNNEEVKPEVNEIPSQEVFNNVMPQFNNEEVKPEVNEIPTQEVFNNVMPQFNNTVQQPVYNNFNNRQSAHYVSSEFDFFGYIIGAFLKPFDRFKKDEEKLSGFKNSAILTLIVVGFITILGLINTVISTVRVTSLWSDEVKWVWDNLKEISYFRIIGTSILMYAGILFAISGIYFLGSLVTKKDANFSKLLGATTTAFVPYALASSLIYPILSYFLPLLGIVAMVVCAIYSVIILLELVNNVISIDNKNTRIYFHVICLSVLIIVGGFVAYKLILGAFSSGLGSLSGLFY